MNTYEGMFLFDPTFAVEWPNVEAEIGRLMSRADAEIVLCKKWDERRLAYEIRGRKRGCYVLTYFKASPDRIRGIERDTQLSEPILRCLILRADELSESVMQATVPADFEREEEERRRREAPPEKEPSEAGASGKAEAEPVGEKPPAEDEKGEADLPSAAPAEPVVNDADPAD